MKPSARATAKSAPVPEAALHRFEAFQLTDLPPEVGETEDEAALAAQAA
jgi:hypothetical protein